MQPAVDLGKLLSKHTSSSGELIRALLAFGGALILGIGGTLLLLMLNSAGNRTLLLLLGGGATLLAVGITLLWLIPAVRRYGQFVELHERGIVLTRGGRPQSLAFADVKQILEDIQANPVTGTTSTTNIELTPHSGPPILLPAGTFSNFTALRDATLAGVTRAMVTRLVALLYQGGSERVGLVNLTRDGILLDKTKGGKGLLVNWESLEGVNLDPQTGNVLLQTSIGVIDTQAWMQAIPHWFFFPLLARAMTQRLTAPKRAP
jgi:hypothetical protein